PMEWRALGARRTSSPHRDRRPPWTSRCRTRRPPPGDDHGDGRRRQCGESAGAHDPRDRRRDRDFASGSQCLAGARPIGSDARLLQFGRARCAGTIAAGRHLAMACGNGGRDGRGRGMSREGPTAALRWFLTTRLDALLPAAAAGDGSEAALALFHETAGKVPAYGRFLAEQGIDPGTIRSAEDFRHLPLTSKANYVNRYPLAERCRAGRIESCDMVAVSSGST